VPALDDDARAELEARITREARTFDLRPLVELLVAKGYERDEILFEGTHEGESASLVEAVRFRPKPHQGVTISLNMGLLGDNSLLPSYFFQVIEGTAEPERFYDFIRYFDHHLLENMRRALFPEDEHGVYRSYERMLRSFFRMLGPGSASTLCWLGQLYFPELGVRVRRWIFTDSSDAYAFRTGESLLDGTGILGRRYQSDAAGLVLDLFAEEETDARGRTWPNVVRLRLNEYLLPLLAPFRIPLVVRLTVLFHASWVRVDVPFAQQHGYLGYERIQGDAESGHTTVLYRGVTGQRRMLRSILFVDDSSVARVSAARRFEERGLPVTSVGWLEAERLSPGHFAAALLGLLPDGSGIDLAARLRLGAPSLPIAFVAGEVAASQLEAARAYGPVFEKTAVDDAVTWIVNKVPSLSRRWSER